VSGGDDLRYSVLFDLVKGIGEDLQDMMFGCVRVGFERLTLGVCWLRY
jgi:hypothetical protein